MKKLTALLLTVLLALGTVFSATAFGDNGVVSNEAKDYLNSLAVTTNFGVYADTFTENCHIDGNICVNNLTTTGNLETLKKGGYSAKGGKVEGLDIYSMVFNGNSLRYGTVDGGAVIVAANLKAQNLNGGSKIVDITTKLNGSENKINTMAEEVVKAVQIADKDRVLKEADITTQLDKIAEKGQTLIDTYSNERTSAVTTIKNAIRYINSYTSDSVINIKVTASEITYGNSTDEGFASQLSKLFVANKNVGATIILNVDASDVNTVISDNPIIGNSPYDVATSKVIWNFGNYEGIVFFNKTTDGAIVAPKATVKVASPIDGRVVAKNLVQGSGQEIHQPNVPNWGLVVEEPETEPTTVAPTTVEPTTAEPTTVEPITVAPTTVEPTTAEPTTAEPTTVEPTTVEPTTVEPTTTPDEPTKKVVDLRVETAKNMAVRLEDGTVYYTNDKIKVEIGKEYNFQMCATNWENGIYDDNGNGVAGTVVYTLKVVNQKDFLALKEEALKDTDRYTVKGMDIIDNINHTIVINCDAQNYHLETDVNNFFVAYRFHFNKGDYNKQTGIKNVVNVPRESLSVNLPVGTTVEATAYKGFKEITTENIFIEKNNGEGQYHSVFLTSVNDYYWNY